MTPQATPTTYQASDYAGLDAGGFSFYYGYEYGRGADGKEVWGFRAKKDGKTVMEYPDEANNHKFDPIAGLLQGIGKYLMENE